MKSVHAVVVCDQVQTRCADGRTDVCFGKAEQYSCNRAPSMRHATLYTYLSRGVLSDALIQQGAGSYIAQISQIKHNPAC